LPPRKFETTKTHRSTVSKYSQTKKLSNFAGVPWGCCVKRLWVVTWSKRLFLVTYPSRHIFRSSADIFI